MTTREFTKRSGDGYLIASDHIQNVTGFGKTDINVAGKTLARDHSNQPLKITRLAQIGEIASRGFKVLQRYSPFASFEGDSSDIQFTVPEQGGNSRSSLRFPQ